MSRSLLRQLEQIRWSATYDDSIANVNTIGVAEPTLSGSLEQDLNVIRTLMKGVKGTANWYDDLGKYFDPTNTDVASSEYKTLNLSNLKNNTLDAKTIIVPVTADNNGQGYTVSGTSTGVSIATTVPYAKPNNRIGLPIFASTANNGTYYDEGGLDRVVRADVINVDTGQEIQDNNGYTIYAKLHDGVDFGGVGDGTDVYARFYANDVAVDLSTVSGGVPSAVKIIYPYRKHLSDMMEYDWLRTDFVNSWEGDVALVDDIHNLWAFTGATDNDRSAQPWNNISGNYLLNSNPASLKGALDALNDGIGDATYVGATYLTSGENITQSLIALDTNLKNVSDTLNAVAPEKYIESPATTIPKNTPHTLPGGASYTPESTSGREGANMDIYVDGQLLAADTGVDGANADRDYGETSTITVTFRFDIQAGRNITYVIRK